MVSVLLNKETETVKEIIHFWTQINRDFKE